MQICYRNLLYFIFNILHLMKQLSLIFISCLMAVSIFAQSTIRGIIKSSDTNLPIQGALVSIENQKKSNLTNENGRFRLSKVEGKTVNLVIEYNEYNTFKISVVLSEEVINLGEIVLQKKEFNAINNSNETIQVIALDNVDAASDDTDNQNVSSQLGATRDLFRQATNYSWGAVRYRQRGYLNNYTEQYFNGVPFNELDDDRIAFNSYGGLNDVTRQQQNYLGLEPNSIAFGDLSGTFYVDTRASMQRKQVRVSYMLNNLNYNHRLMATYSTGLNQKGWAVTLSGSRRWAQEGYVPGTFMDAYAYFAAVDKKLNKKHLFNLTVFGAPIKQGRSGPAIQEMFDLSGTNYYNPFWGYQEGKKRNARVQNTHSPTAIFRHDYTPNNKLTVTTAASFQYERFGQTDIDWFNAPDPRPDYYSKLPSAVEDPEQKMALTKLLTENEAARQINWTAMYNINRAGLTTVNNATVDGVTGQTITGTRSKYVLFERRNDSREANIYSNFQYQLAENQQIVGGLAYRYFRSEDFKTLQDLLGGDFFLDIDQFAERDFPGQNLGQNDIRFLNRIVKENDRYGYDYSTNVRNAFAWGQYTYNTPHFDYFVAAKAAYNRFWREGLTQNGRFPDNSLGDSEKPQFFNYGTKAGVTYKLDGRNYFHFYGGYMTKAPSSRDAFLSPRTRNELASGLTNEKIMSLEGGYNYRSPYFSFQAKGYLTNFKDKVRAISFYADEDRAFVNYVAKGLDFQHAGIEIATEWKPTNSLEVYAAGTLAQHIYTSRPVATATPDNGVTSIQSNINGQTIYIKGYYVPNTPQLAGVTGFRYIGKRFWSINMNVNYFARRYMDINFNRRTEYAISKNVFGTDKLIKDSPEWNEIVDQPKLPDVLTVNILANKSFRIRRNYFLNFTVGINNVLDNQFIMSAFEQWRFDWEEKDVNTFPPKYFYGFGRNYFALASLRF
jgi:hypothetical protein